jgi:hypothetical protein
MFAALISAKTAKQTEVLSGVKQTTKVMGSSRGERLAPLRMDDVANRAAITILDGMGQGAAQRGRIERGGHDDDQ